jgi:Domain of unknown function (DUF4249)
MLKNFKNILGLLVILSSSCVEEIEISTNAEFESLLVVEATISNELINQKVLLSRSMLLENGFNPIPESNATVVIKDSNGNVYTFQENELGEYLSAKSFGAQPNLDYSLEISTSDGKQYSSSKMKLTQTTLMDNLYFERGFNENENEGISVFIDAFDPLGSSKYYRFEYEETYKVIAPLYSPKELIASEVIFPLPAGTLDLFDLQSVIDFLVDLQFRPKQEQICYNTVTSNTILITSTTDLFEDRLDKFRVRFINRDNYIISHRYSIKVRQYVQSREAYVFYKTLKSFSDSESLFSENQVGFIEGNVFSVNDQKERVIGFFEVSSVDEKRIFFNYKDLFPDEGLPPYYTSCDNFFMPALLVEDFAHNLISSPLLDALNEGFQYYDKTNDENPNPFEHAPFILVLEPCGDCTVLGSNERPDFWID